MGREDAAAAAGLELQLGRGAWRAAHGPTAWGAAGAGGAKGGDGLRCQRVLLPRRNLDTKKFVNLIDVQYASLFILPSIRISFEFHLLSFIFFFIFILQAC